MLNLKELSERYKDVGLGYIRFGGKYYYEINSEIPLSLNSFGGSQGFILNNKEEVELFEFFDEPRKCYLKGIEITEIEFSKLVEFFNDDDLEDEFLTIAFGGTRKWWGKTLDNYYPHPWYPDKKIVAFELVNDIPEHRKGKVFELTEFQIRPAFTVSYSINDCLYLPEFFKPLYDESN